jgi:Holliday junction DNA helicase RuvA
MISRLTGTIGHIDLKYVILDVGGVGYKVFTTADLASQIGNKSNKGGEKTSQTITIWTYLAVRDNALDLYGFPNLAELNFFELLIGISGIGPKTALGILNVASVGAIDSAIRSGDASHLVKVGGLSKKMAEKIVLELRDKMDDMPEFGATDTGTDEENASARSKMKEVLKSDADTIEALKSLGYTPAEARDAVKQLEKNFKNAPTGEKVKAALKILGM